MDLFEKALAFTLQNEGELCSVEGDAGGLTKYGISKRSYPHLDIANLTKEKAAEIYRRDFWPPIKTFPERLRSKSLTLP